MLQKYYSSLELELVVFFFIRKTFTFLLLLIGIAAFAQQDTIPPAPADTIPNNGTDTLKRPTPTTTDTVKKKSATATGLEEEVKYSADDSIRFDKVNSLVHLYGRARISYQDFELDADYIRLDQKNNTVFASGLMNKNKRYNGKPIFKQGSEPPITTDSLAFNFKTKKGKSYGVFSEVEGGFLQSKQFKKNEFNEGFFKNGIYSTCNLPHPHFGIHITRGIVTEKQIISGPAYLVIEDVPFPAGVPFGFFPKPNRRASGILFPTFGEDGTRGFFMRDLGYYVGLNDYWDLAVRGTLYTKGSYEGSAAARYRKNYKYDGTINMRYASTKNGIEGTPAFSNPSKDFNITWSHSQAAQANPGTTFSASVNAGTSNYFQNTAAGGTYDIDQITRNTMNSSISYGKVFGPNDMFNFTSSLGHSQDLLAQTISLRLPEFSLNMSTINPFDSKNRVGEQKWYQKIAVGYSVQGSNSIDTKESLLFRKESLKDFQNGMQHTIPVNLSLNVLRFFQFNTGVNYTERWYLQSIRKRYGPTPNSNYGEVTDTVQGFNRQYQYNLNAGLSTKVYGQMNFKKSKLIALRHVATPSVNLSYQPDFADERFGYYRVAPGDTTRNPLTGDIRTYSIFQNAIYGSPSQGRQASLGFSVDNTIEAKVRTKKDSASNVAKIPIIQGLSFSGNYNFAADSFQLSDINFSGRTSIFKQKLALNFNGTLDPYQLDESGRVIDELLIKKGRLVRLTSFGFSTSFSFNSNAAASRNQQQTNLEEQLPNATPQQREAVQQISRDPNAFVDFNVPWNISASYSFQYSNDGRNVSRNNVLQFNGDLSVTPNWKVQYNSGYDFVRKELTLPQFSIYRDLHCWDLSFRWVPIGQYKSWSVDLRVRASVLQDLKLSRRSSFNSEF